jgi:hypothetical protein
VHAIARGQKIKPEEKQLHASLLPFGWKIY